MNIGIELQGRLVKDVNVGTKKDGEGKVVSFQFAGNSIFKTPVFFIVYVRSPYLQNLVVNTLKKGDKVFVKGELDVSKYETAEGKQLTYHNIYADEIAPIGTWVYPEKKDQPTTLKTPDAPEDLPF